MGAGSHGALGLLHVAVASAAAAVVQEVPVVDLQGDRAAAAAALDAALRRFGFFYAAGHGISDGLLAEQFEQSAALFGLPAAVKRNLTFVPHLDIGYVGSGRQALDEESGAGDAKEGFVMTNNAVFDEAFALDPQDPLAGSTLHLPPETLLPRYEPVMRRWAAELHRVNRELNELMFDALNLSRDERSGLAQRPLTVLKQLRYAPASHTVQDASASAPAPVGEALGAGAHTDWGALTVLATDRTPGLEIELNGAWLPVPPRDGCVIVNAGDQISFWTSGFYRSANHRVRAVAPTPRYSTAHFGLFDYHALVKPLARLVRSTQEATPREPITTKDWFAFKLCESVGLDVDSCNAAGKSQPKAEL